MGKQDSSKIEALDEKFWVWETLEEAIRPEVDGLGEEELMGVMSGFYVNLKGSEDLQDVIETRIASLAVTSPFSSGVNPFHQ